MIKTHGGGGRLSKHENGFKLRRIHTSALKPYFPAFLEMLKNNGTNARDVKIHQDSKNSMNKIGFYKKNQHDQDFDFVFMEIYHFIALHNVNILYSVKIPI